MGIPPTYYFVFTLDAKPDAVRALLRDADDADALPMPDEIAASARKMLQWAKQHAQLDPAKIDLLVCKVVRHFTRHYSSGGRGGGGLGWGSGSVPPNLPLSDACRLLRRIPLAHDTCDAAKSVDVFDFSGTSRMAPDSAAAVVRAVDGEVRARGPLLVQPIGDALQEPFWPQGLGINRGLLNAQDACWMAHHAPPPAAPEAAWTELLMQRNWLYAHCTMPMSAMARTRLKGYGPRDGQGGSQLYKTFTVDPATRYHLADGPCAHGPPGVVAAAATPVATPAATPPATPAITPAATPAACATAAAPVVGGLAPAVKHSSRSFHTDRPAGSAEGSAAAAVTAAVAVRRPQGGTLVSLPEVAVPVAANVGAYGSGAVPSAPTSSAPLLIGSAVPPVGCGASEGASEDASSWASNPLLARLGDASVARKAAAFGATVRSPARARHGGEGEEDSDDDEGEHDSARQPSQRLDADSDTPRTFAAMSWAPAGPEAAAAARIQALRRGISDRRLAEGRRRAKLAEQASRVTAGKATRQHALQRGLSSRTVADAIRAAVMRGIRTSKI